MPRIRYPRPTVHVWVGKSGKKFWKAEWHNPKHRAETWPCSEFSKTKAQELCDALVREEMSGGSTSPDGRMLVRDFWAKVFYPVSSRRWAHGTRLSYESTWRKYIEPAIGKQELQHVIKYALECILGNMADAGLGLSVIKRAHNLAHELFVEAVENGYVAKNPARRIKLPNCRGHQETQALTPEQVLAIWGSTTGRDRLMWRILFLTGCRPGELFALQKSDLVPGGLLIDETAGTGRVGPTKNRKVRIAPLPATLRAELSEWIAAVESHLMFPARYGGLLSLSRECIREMLERTRKAVGLPKLTFRQCRTTFATLFEGDAKDRQAILGHHSEAFTQAVYQKPIPARQQASVEELESRLSGKVVALPKRESA